MFSFKKAAFSAAVALFAASLTIPAQAAEWRGWNIHKPGYPNTVAMDKFAELLKEKSGGKMTLKMFHSGTLGTQPDAIEQVRKRLLEGDATEDDLKAIDKEIKEIVNEAAEFSKESPEPALSELWTDIYVDADASQSA